MSENKTQGSSILLVFLAICAILIIGSYGAYRIARHLSRSQETAATQPTTDTTTPPVANDTTQPSAQTPTTSPVTTSTTSLSAGNTNADLDKDLQTIGTKVNSANNANTDVNTSFTNQTQDTPTNN